MMHRIKINTVYVLLSCLFFSCSNHRDVKKVKAGNYTIEAKFIDGKIIDGKAIYRDSLGRLASITTYDHGMRNGTAMNFFPNGKVSDSVRFQCDKEIGFWMYYDSSGIKEYSNYYYYGLQYGPVLIYDSGRLKKFLFFNLDRTPTVECFYDGSGNLDSIAQFRMDLTVVDMQDKNKPLKSLFAYLPMVPGTDQSFSIGLTNKEHADKKLYNVSGHNFFIDTLLPVPPLGWYYFIACNLKANNKPINKYFIEVRVSK